MIVGTKECVVRAKKEEEINNLQEIRIHIPHKNQDTNKTVKKLLPTLLKYIKRFLK